MNLYWHFAMGRSPDGWVVLYATNSDESDDEILATGLENAPHKQADSGTVRVIHFETANAEEKAIFNNFLLLTVALLEEGKMTLQPYSELDDQ